MWPTCMSASPVTAAEIHWIVLAQYVVQIMSLEAEVYVRPDKFGWLTLRPACRLEGAQQVHPQLE